MTIAEQVTELKAAMAGQLPDDVFAAFAADQARFAAEGVPAGLATVGTPMSDGDLLDVRGKPTSLEQARDGKPAVVVFYRGAWCPYCNIALRAYQQQLVPSLTERGVALIAVSPQKPDGSLSMQETNELTFTVLSDPGNQLAGALGVTTTHGAEAAAAAGRLGVDLTTANADGTDVIPMPTTVLVDADGVIRWLDVHPDYTSRTEPAEILDRLTLIYP